jgi:LPXTG-motif cell wall-anchored protein
MNRVARKGLVTVVVAGGVLASAGYAQADSTAGGETAGSSGVLSGNSVQVPVHVPVNVCGNTVDVIGLLNRAAGNHCANSSSDSGAQETASPATGSAVATMARPAHRAGTTSDASSIASGGAHAAGSAHHSQGVLSGNSVQLPVDVPVNISGNSVNVVGVGNRAAGNTSVNDETQPPVRTLPAPAHLPIPAPPNEETVAAPTLAHTGADNVGWAAAGSAGLLLGGAVLFRRFRPGRG